MVIHNQYFHDALGFQLNSIYRPANITPFTIVAKKNPAKPLACGMETGPWRTGQGGVWPSGYQPPWIFIITGTISSATMLMILIKGLIAGPAVSL